MFQQYLKISVRNLWKNRSFSLINIIGLSLGLASIMTLCLLVQQYRTTDGFHTNKDRIYYLKTFTPEGDSYQQTTFPLLYEVLNSCPEVEAGSHWQSWNYPWLKYKNKEVQETTRYVDTGFFSVFSFPLKEGNPNLALKEKYSAVISEKVAFQLFGKEKALGKIIRASDTLQLTVTGVLEDLKSNSSLKADILLTTQLLNDIDGFKEGAGWYNTFAENYLKLKEGADPKVLDQKLSRIVQQNYVEEARESIVKTVAFANLKKEGGAIISTIISGAIASAAFILLIIIANLLNLNTATMFNRTKEVAVRQMIGSNRKNIVFQFCVENALIVLTSLLFGFLLFTQLLLPQINTIVGSNFGNILFQWQKDFPLIVFFVAIASIIVIVAASIPAVYLTSLKISEAVKGKVTDSGNSHWVRNSFITIQFALAIILITITIILNSQIRYMKNASLGFNRDQVVVVDLDLAFRDEKLAASRFEAIISSLKNSPYVKSVSTSPVVPTSYWDNYNTYIDRENNKEVSLRHVPADAGYINTYQIPLKEGRNFDDDLYATENNKFIINETAAKAFGWRNPVGRTIEGKGGGTAGTVIGVMKDFHYSNLENPIEPLLHWYTGKPSLYNRYMSLRLDMKHSKTVLSALEQQFKTMPSRRPFRYQFMNELVEAQYSLLDGILRVTNYVAWLTILIASMGMLGLITLFARRRIKEIGVRKVMGATVVDITTLLSKNFLKLVVIATVIAIPVANWSMSKWLEDFSYRIDIQWWMFAFAGILAVVIALITVSFQAIKAALMSPVKSLRSE